MSVTVHFMFISGHIVQSFLGLNGFKTIFDGWHLIWTSGKK